MVLMGALSSPPDCTTNTETGIETCVGGRDAYIPLQIAMSAAGLVWIALLGGRVKKVSELPDDAWRTKHSLLDEDKASTSITDEESNGGKNGILWGRRQTAKRE